MIHQISIRAYTDEYLLAFGRFIIEFSEIEQAMQVALWNLTKLEDPVAKAIFSGVRADDACNKITRIADAENWSNSKKAEWKMIADRLGHLRTLRNDILHYGVQWQPGGDWITTNRSFAHTAKKITTTPVSVPILVAATADLRKLSLHLFHFLFVDDMSVVGTRALDPTLQSAWQYKPSRQAGRADKPQHNSPKRSRRRPSSPA